MRIPLFAVLGLALFIPSFAHAMGGKSQIILKETLTHSKEGIIRLDSKLGFCMVFAPRKTRFAPRAGLSAAGCVVPVLNVGLTEGCRSPNQPIPAGTVFKQTAHAPSYASETIEWEAKINGSKVLLNCRLNQVFSAPPKPEQIQELLGKYAVYVPAKAKSAASQTTARGRGLAGESKVVMSGGSASAAAGR